MKRYASRMIRDTTNNVTITRVVFDAPIWDMRVLVGIVGMPGIPGVIFQFGSDRELMLRS
jgi:hypothetical protein